jgi:hypothetical protein
LSNNDNLFSYFHTKKEKTKFYDKKEREKNPDSDQPSPEHIKKTFLMTFFLQTMQINKVGRRRRRLKRSEY